MNSSIFQQLLLGLTAAANIILGLIILKKNPRLLLNRLFFGFAVNTSLWNFMVLIITVQAGYDGLLFWVRITHAVAVITPWFLFSLAQTFRDDGQYPYLRVYSMFFPSLTLAVICFTPAIIKDIVIAPEGNISYLYGFFFPMYPLLFGGVTILALYKLFKELRSSQGLVRLRIRYFFGGILLSFIVGSLVNLFLPLLGITTTCLRNIGPVSTLFAVLSITYAITRYRLMDIHMALRKLLAYCFSISFLTVISVVPILLLESKFGVSLDTSWLIYYLVLLITLVAVLFQPLNEGVQTLVDRYFYQGAYDYFETLKNANSAIVTILNRDDLFAFLLGKIVKTVYIRGAVFYLKDTTGNFRSIAEKKWGDPSALPSLSLMSHSPLLIYLQKEKEVLLKTDLNGMSRGEKRGLLEGEMEKIGAEAVVPLFLEGKLEGVFSLGPKLSGEPYSQEDVNLLTTIASQVTVALRNAQLYQEVLVIKRHLENILENMKNGLLTVAANGRVTTFNSAAEHLTGLRADQVLGQNLGGVLEGALYELFLQTMDKGESHSDLELTIDKGGTIFYLSCSAVLVELPETQEQEAIIVLSDVTRVKELEQEKNKVLRLASLGEVAAGMAHEIKNPLVSIKTFAELLPAKYDDEEFRFTFSRIVSQEIERINRLLMDLLNFTKGARLSYEELSVESLLDEILAQLSPQLQEQKIELQRSYGEEVPLVRADRDQLKQAFFNICLNAVQAMPRGGRLSVAVEAARLRGGGDNGSPLQVNGLKVRIKDTGEGIAFKERERVFHPFFTTKSQGVGIGLSISHKIITAHQGQIKFNSNGQGTVFEICLPVAISEKHHV